MNPPDPENDNLQNNQGFSGDLPQQPTTNHSQTITTNTPPTQTQQNTPNIPAAPNSPTPTPTSQISDNTSVPQTPQPGTLIDDKPEKKKKGGIIVPLIITTFTIAIGFIGYFIYT